MTVTGATWGGKRLAFFRGRAGKTQAQVAEEAGLDRSVVVALEKGRRTLTRYYAARLAPVVGAKPAELLEPDPDDIRPGDPLARLEALEEAAVRAEDLAPLLRAVQLLAAGKRSEALRVLSEAAEP